MVSAEPCNRSHRRRRRTRTTCRTEAFFPPTTRTGTERDHVDRPRWRTLANQSFQAVFRKGNPDKKNSGWHCAGIFTRKIASPLFTVLTRGFRRLPQGGKKQNSRRPRGPFRGSEVGGGGGGGGGGERHPSSAVEGQSMARFAASRDAIRRARARTPEDCAGRGFGGTTGGNLITSFLARAGRGAAAPDRGHDERKGLGAGEHARAMGSGRDRGGADG